MVNHFTVLLLQVVEQGMFVKHCKVEVYLTELKLCEDGNMDNVITRRFSKADTIGKPESIGSNCLCHSSVSSMSSLHYMLLG